MNYKKRRSTTRSLEPSTRAWFVSVDSQLARAALKNYLDLRLTSGRMVMLGP